MNSDLKQLISLSKYAGERFDLTQAGGGNSSWKHDSTLYVKASGTTLSEMSDDYGYTTLNLALVRDIFEQRETFSSSKRDNDSKINELTQKAVTGGYGRPSIETLLHSQLFSFTLHNHSLAANIITARTSWDQELAKLFPEAALCKYKTPGFELAFELYDVIQEHKGKFAKEPELIFLQNHGMIVSTESSEEVILKTDQVVERLEEYLKIDLSKYRFTNKISSYLNSAVETSNISYLVESESITNFFGTKLDLEKILPFCPDVQVFCGVQPLLISSLDDSAALKSYLQKYRELPKIVLYHDSVFISAKNIKKAKEIEEVLKFQIEVLKNNQHSELNYLSEEEIAYLSNWDAEKYRQKI